MIFLLLSALCITLLPLIVYQTTILNVFISERSRVLVCDLQQHIGRMMR